MWEKGVIHTESETNRMRERSKNKVKPKRTEDRARNTQKTTDTRNGATQ